MTAGPTSGSTAPGSTAPGSTAPGSPAPGSPAPGSPAPDSIAPPPGAARRTTSVLAWAGVMLIVAVAGAGLILSLDHPPTDEARPELTARGHALVTPRLAAMDPDLEALAMSGDAIALAGRDTLTRLRALDVPGTQDALVAGDAATADLPDVHDRLLTARAGLLEGTSLDRVPAVDRARITSVDAALAAARELPPEWQAVVAAASGPRDLLEAMAAHDASVVAATDAGRAGDWDAALAALDDAAGSLVTVRTVREIANSNGADVSTLDDLLDRIEEYDAALTELYASMRASGGETTAASRAAEARVDAAQRSLPEDQEAMVIVMSDLAGPTITPVLLRIESTRGLLEDALPAEVEPSDAGAGPSEDVPEPTDGVSS